MDCLQDFSYLGEKVRGVCPVHIPHWRGIIPKIQKPEAFMLVMVPTSRVKTVM